MRKREIGAVRTERLNTNQLLLEQPVYAKTCPTIRTFPTLAKYLEVIFPQPQLFDLG